MRRLLLYISGIGFAALAYAGINNLTRLSNTEDALKSHLGYVKAQKIESINESLNNSERHLEYLRAGGTTQGYRSETLPKAKTARAEIKDCLEKLANVESLKAASQDAAGDLETVAKGLKEVYETLPDEDDVEKYNGSDVNKSTFEKERNKIAETQKILSAKEKAYMDEVPKDLIERKKNEQAKGILSFIGATLSLCLGLYLLKTKESK